MAAEFKQILKAFALAETKSIDPTELVKIIRTHPLGEEFCDGGQHDCQEIMRVLMDSLHEDLNRARKEQAGQAGDPDEDGISEREKADRAWRRYLERDHSPITDLFCGQLQSSITCHKCETRCTMYEPFWDLSIPITKESMNKKGLSAWFGSGEPSLEDCLRAFTSDEILSVGDL
jgi:ubiquitin carboxyl-terminal hydrolase 2/21